MLQLKRCLLTFETLEFSNNNNNDNIIIINQLDSLIQTVRIFSMNIGMKFGIEKYAVLVLKRGKLPQVRRDYITRRDYNNSYERRRWIQIFRSA